LTSRTLFCYTSYEGGVVMSCLSLYLFGSPRIEIDGLPVKVDTRKAIALLAYIAITGQKHQRDGLVNLLWPEFDQTRGRATLRRSLYALRKALDGEYLDVDRDTVGLDPSAGIWLDVEQFHGYLNECLAHGHSLPEACSDCIPPLTKAVELYRGDFLSGFTLKDSYDFDEWQFFQAETLRREQIFALESLAKSHSAQEAYKPAVDYARKWLALDLLNEDAHRQLMLLYARSRQRSAALRQYQECEKILNDELGAQPQDTTTALYNAILEGRIPEPSVAVDQQQSRQVFQTLEPISREVVQTAPPPRWLREAADARPNLFVAREQEMALLDRFYDEAMAGQGRVLFIIGGAGRGKTATIQEFARRAQDRSSDLVFAGGNCNAHTGLGDPYLPFREVLGLLTSDVDALWHAGAITREHARRLWEVFPLSVRALLDVGPDLINTLISGSALVRRAEAYTAGGISGQLGWLSQLEALVESKTAAPHDPNLQQSALLEQYTRVMRALARERPLLLSLDDLQWADAGSLGLLFHLGRGVVNSRVLVVGAYRPEELALGRGGERHPLEAVIHEFQRSFGDVIVDLAHAENRQFVEQYLDAEPNNLGGEFRETLYRQTKGHPLFTIELLHGMEERGDLVHDGAGRWVEGPALDWETLPARAEAVIAERVDCLDAGSREALRVACVEGEIFTAEVLARVLGTDKREIVACLSGKLERRHRLVRAQEMQRLGARRISRYRFRHILFQSYLYHDLDPIERAHLHEAVGIALEELYGDDAPEIAVALARHFEQAGSVDKAIRYLSQAAEKAARLSANQDAIAHLRRALALLRSLPASAKRTQQELDLHIALGVPLVLTRGHSAPEVEDLYVGALELSEQVGDAHQRFQVLHGLRRVRLSAGEIQKARDLGEALIALAQDERDAALLARAHFMQGEAMYVLGEFAKAREHGREAKDLIDLPQSSAHIALYGTDTGVGGRLYEALALWHLGYPDQALSAAQETISLARALSHPFTLVFALCFVADLYQFRREQRKVRELVQEVLEISEKHGFVLYSAWGTALLGWALAEEGEEQDGINHMYKGIDALQAIGVTWTQSNYRALIAQAYAQVGRTQDGLRLLLEALVQVGSTGEGTFEAEMVRLQGELTLLGVDDAYKAEECFQRALQVARRQGARSWELRAAMSMSRLWRKQGKTADARKLLHDVYTWFAEGFDTADLRDARALLYELG
jgi:DNA-binding SARP family transcriptional activator/predicted ATPase